jgi:hypothetical protein
MLIDLKLYFVNRKTLLSRLIQGKQNRVSHSQKGEKEKTIILQQPERPYARRFPAIIFRQVS